MRRCGLLPYALLQICCPSAELLVCHFKSVLASVTLVSWCADAADEPNA